jgi:hypothetical protein
MTVVLAQTKGSVMATPAEVIDWIETELNDDANFRDIPEILTEARQRFAGPIRTLDKHPIVLT